MGNEYVAGHLLHISRVLSKQVEKSCVLQLMDEQGQCLDEHILQSSICPQLVAYTSSALCVAYPCSTLCEVYC